MTFPKINSVRLHKRVIHFFKSNSGHRPMSGINLRIIRQCEKLGLNTIDQSIKIPAWKIRPANASIK